MTEVQLDWLPILSRIQLRRILPDIRCVGQRSTNRLHSNSKPPRFLEWACTLCHSVRVSDRHEAHQMDTCECGSTSVDAEREYTRVCGCLRVQWMSH